MMMVEKNRFGVNMIIFVFLLSFYSATAVYVTGVSYIPLKVDHLNYKKLVTELDTKINVAKGQGHKFYIGVAMKPDDATRTIQALCARQGKPNAKLVPATATSCPSESTHRRDRESEECRFKLTEIYYADDFVSKTLVCGTEKELIAKYYNNCRVDPLCLNRQVGIDDCIKATEGIVYLRIYK